MVPSSQSFWTMNTNFIQILFIEYYTKSLFKHPFLSLINIHILNAYSFNVFIFLSIFHFLFLPLLPMLLTFVPPSLSPLLLPFFSIIIQYVYYPKWTMTVKVSSLFGVKKISWLVLIFSNIFLKTVLRFGHDLSSSPTSNNNPRELRHTEQC